MSILEPYKILAVGLTSGDIQFWGIGLGRDEEEEKVIEFMRNQKLRAQKKKRDLIKKRQELKIRKKKAK
jgi:hypothetical protein